MKFLFFNTAFKRYSVAEKIFFTLCLRAPRASVLKSKSLQIIFFALFSLHMSGQGLLLKNETKLYSFKTKSSKQVIVAKDSSNNYLIYRFGTSNKIEFEFPEKTKSSFKKFKYSFYMRGGGAQNEGMDLNYLYFENDNFKYIIYDTYYAAGNKHSIGVKVVDLKTKKTTDIKGEIKTQKGSLTDFRDNTLVEITEEFFD